MHIHDLHSRLGFQALRKVVQKRDHLMRALAITIDDQEAWRTRLDLRPTYGIGLGGWTLQITREHVI